MSMILRLVLDPVQLPGRFVFLVLMILFERTDLRWLLSRWREWQMEGDEDDICLFREKRRPSWLTDEVDDEEFTSSEESVELMSAEEEKIPWSLGLRVLLVLLVSSSSSQSELSRLLLLDWKRQDGKDSHFFEGEDDLSVSGFKFSGWESWWWLWLKLLRMSWSRFMLLSWSNDWQSVTSRPFTSQAVTSLLYTVNVALFGCSLWLGFFFSSLYVFMYIFASVYGCLERDCCCHCFCCCLDFLTRERSCCSFRIESDILLLSTDSCSSLYKFYCSCSGSIDDGGGGGGGDQLEEEDDKKYAKRQSLCPREREKEREQGNKR